jgi:hypothetical protein
MVLSRSLLVLSEDPRFLRRVSFYVRLNFAFLIISGSISFFLCFALCSLSFLPDSFDVIPMGLGDGRFGDESCNPGSDFFVTIHD